jgi:porin
MYRTFPLKCAILLALGLGSTAVRANADDRLRSRSDAIAGPLERLSERGLRFGLSYISDMLANVRGGQRRGVIYQGLIDASIELDFEKLSGIVGLTAYANVFQIHNTGRIRRDYVGGINTIAAIEAVPTTRLSEAWLQQGFADGKANLRLGQLAADKEFFFASASEVFLQSDWPTIAAENLPRGGPAYPLSTPGVRLKFEPSGELALLLAAFNGDPAGPGPGDAQLRNRYGLNFRVRDRALLMAEAQLRSGHEKDSAGFATTIKIGAWSHLGRFDDQRWALDGSLLADPAGAGAPARRRGNDGFYAIAEQQLYRAAGGGPDSGVIAFGRVSYSPPDRNPIDFYVDGGLVFAGLVPGRPSDRFGASLIYARFSKAARAAAIDRIAFGEPSVVRDYEANLELTYQAQIVPGWLLQPVLTYVRHPNGESGRDALVTGARSIIRF